MNLYQQVFAFGLDAVLRRFYEVVEMMRPGQLLDITPRDLAALFPRPELPRSDDYLKPDTRLVASMKSNGLEVGISFNFEKNMYTLERKNDG